MQDQNFYRPIPPHSMTEEDEAKDWHPRLSHRDSRIDSVLLKYSNPRLSKSSNPRSQEQVATLAPQKVNYPSNEIEPSSERDPRFNLIAKKKSPIGDLSIIRTFLANLSLNPLPIESPSSPTLLTNNQKPICASANTSILLVLHVNSKALPPTESALIGKRREPQGQSQVIPTVGKHLQKLKLSYPPGYYKHESVQVQTFNVINKANKHIDPSIKPLVTCETEPLSGLQTYTHVLGNVYKPTPLLLSQSSD